MKSIREAVMSQRGKEESKTPSLWPAKEMSPDEDYYDSMYGSTPTQSDYIPKWSEKYVHNKPGQINISTTIQYEEVGKIADYSEVEYDPEKAETMATEIAYDRIEALAGKGYESRYTVKFEVTDYGEYEVKATLIPIKK